MVSTIGYYPPDKQEKATQTVLEQAEVLSQEWAAA
jgi:type I restriction enzyme R subunit